MENITNKNLIQVTLEMPENYEKSYQVKGFVENRNVLLEVLVRLVLYKNLAKTKKISLVEKEINHDITSSIFQWSPIDSNYIYQIFFSIDTLKLDYRLFIDTVFDQKDDVDPIEFYFHLFYNIDQNMKDDIGYSITDSIVDWNKYVKGKNSGIEIGVPFTPYDLELFVNDSVPLKLNKHSKFVEKTDHIIEDIKQDFITNYEKVFRQQFKLEFSQIIPYLDSVKNFDYDRMKSCLSQVKMEDPKQLDLMIQLTDFPYLEYINIEDYHKHLDKEILNTILDIVVLKQGKKRYLCRCLI